MHCQFVTDLHGRIEKYDKLFAYLRENPPDRLFIGGDILPLGVPSNSAINVAHKDFINDYLAPGFLDVRESLGEKLYLPLWNTGEANKSK